MEKFKPILIGLLTFILGFYLCNLFATGSGNQYLDRLDAIYNACIYIASSIFVVGYLLFKKK